MTTSTIEIAQFNCGNKPPERTPDDLRKIGADLYCPQETWDRRKVLKQWAKAEGFESVPFERGIGDTPQFYDQDKAKVLDFWSHPVNSKTVYVGDKGNGPASIHPKFVTHTRYLLLDSNRIINVLNTHVLASWTRRDLPPEEQRKRHALGLEHVEVVADLVRRLHNVVVCGDFNAPIDYPGMRPLVSLMDWKGSNGPDFIGVKGKPRIHGADFFVVRGTSSDHNAVKTRLTLGKRARS